VTSYIREAFKVHFLPYHYRTQLKSADHFWCHSTIHDRTLQLMFGLTFWSESYDHHWSIVIASVTYLLFNCRWYDGID